MVTRACSSSEVGMGSMGNKGQQRKIPAAAYAGRREARCLLPVTPATDIVRAGYRFVCCVVEVEV